MGSGKKDFNGIKEVLTAGPYLPHDAKDKVYLIPVNPDLVNPCDKNGMTEIKTDRIRKQVLKRFQKEVFDR